MKRILTSLVVLSLILLTGCAGTALRPEVAFKPAANQKFTYEIDNKAQMTDEGLTILRERLTSQLTASGIHTASSDGTAMSVKIAIDTYYMRHGATRALVGIMAGSDNILSTVVVKDGKSGAEISKFQVESKNPTAWGTSRGMIEEHADKVVNYLKSGQL